MVTATNSAGTSSVTSNLTSAVLAKATSPVNSRLPAISGSATVGQTLHASSGAWTGVAMDGLAFQWNRCNSNGSACSSEAHGEDTPVDVVVLSPQRPSDRHEPEQGRSRRQRGGVQVALPQLPHSGSRHADADRVTARRAHARPGIREHPYGQEHLGRAPRSGHPRELTHNPDETGDARGPDGAPSLVRPLSSLVKRKPP